LQLKFKSSNTPKDLNKEGPTTAAGNSTEGMNALKDDLNIDIE